MADKILRELRVSKKITQAEMAELLGIERSTYTKYESGKSKPDLNMLKKIADYFGVTVDYLLGRSNTFIQQEQKIETKACHNLDTSGLPEEAIKQVEDYLELMKLKYKPDGTLKRKNKLPINKNKLI